MPTRSTSGSTLSLCPLANTAWEASLAALSGQLAPEYARAVLHEVLLAKVARIAWATRIRTAAGAQPTAFVGAPTYDELAAVSCHYPITLDAAHGPLLTGNHMVVFPTLCEPMPHAAIGPCIGFEILNTWRVRLPKALDMLSPLLRGELHELGRQLRDDKDASHEAILRAIRSHERGHYNVVWPIYPTEPTWVKAARTKSRARQNDSERVVLNALGDLAADLYGPFSHEPCVMLVTLAYHWDNLGRGMPMTDPDNFNAQLIFRMLGDRQSTIDIAVLANVFAALRETLDHYAYQLKHDHFQPDFPLIVGGVSPPNHSLLAEHAFGVTLGEQFALEATLQQQLAQVTM